MKAVTVTRRVRVVAAAVVLAAPLLTSCGFNPATDEVYQPAVGSLDRSSAIDVLNTLVVAPENGSGTLVASLVNKKLHRKDTLTGVTATAPSAGQDTGRSTGVRVDVPTPVPVPGGQLVKLADSGITVTGPAVRPGYIVRLTFTFAHTNTVTFNVPVVRRTGDYANVPLPAVSSPAPASPSPGPPTTGHTKGAQHGSHPRKQKSPGSGKG